MRFLLDHNVLGAIQRCLEEHDHDVAWSKALVGQDAADPVVAVAAMEFDRVLISHDNDMKRVHRFISESHRARFPKLCRVMFQCSQAETIDRMRTYMAQIQFEFHQAQLAGKPLMVVIQKTRYIICR